jgi:hypothetical protein
MRISWPLATNNWTACTVSLRQFDFHPNWLLSGFQGECFWHFFWSKTWLPWEEFLVGLKLPENGDDSFMMANDKSIYAYFRSHVPFGSEHVEYIQKLFGLFRPFD